jgi:hypothetical protein
MAGFNKRETLRYKAALPVEYWLARDTNLGPYLGVTLNFSLTGTAFRSAAKASAHEVLLVSLGLPGRPKPLRMTAKVMTCTASESWPGQWVMGLKFVEPSEGEVLALSSALETLRDGRKF